MSLLSLPGQYTDATQQLQKAVGFIKDTYSADLEGYTGNNVKFILAVLQHKYGNQSQEEDSADENRRRRRHVIAPHLIDIGALIGENSLTKSAPQSESDSFLQSASVIWDRYLKHDTTTRTKRHNRRSLFHSLTGNTMRSQRGHSERTALVPEDDRPLRVRRGSNGAEKEEDFPDLGVNFTIDYSDFTRKPSSETLLSLAHIMHYISIAILGVFVIQVSM